MDRFGVLSRPVVGRAGLPIPVRRHRIGLFAIRPVPDFHIELQRTFERDGVQAAGSRDDGISFVARSITAYLVAERSLEQMRVAPRITVIIFRAGTEMRRETLIVDPDLFVSLAPPIAYGVVDSQWPAAIMNWRVLSTDRWIS